MGAPFWSKEEKSYFADVILPMSKYAGGSYSNSQGIDFAELAAIMQTELDRRGTSRRQYTGDMLFQHYYQKCSARSYNRGEGDHVTAENSMSRASSSSMDPPLRPTFRRRPETKRPSMTITYGHASTQTDVTVEAGSESELALQGYPRYSGPPAVLYESITADSNLEVQPVTTSTNKRKHQATVEDINDDDDDDSDDYFPLKDESLEAAMQPVVRKKATSVHRNASKNETRDGDGMFKSMDEISKLLNTQPSEPERHRPAKLHNPWDPSFGARPQTPLGRARGFTSPRSDTHSESTSSIAYKTYTPSLLFDRPCSLSDTSRPSRHRRSMAKSFLEESSGALSRASDRHKSGHGAFQSVRSPQREISRDSNREELENRATSPTIRSPQRESSRAASLRDESQTSRLPRSPPRMSMANDSPRYDKDDNWYPGERRRSLFGPPRYQGLGSRKQTPNKQEPTRCSIPDAFRSARSLKACTDNTRTPITTQAEDSTTSRRTPLPNFRKRTKQQHATSYPSPTQPQHTTQPSRPTKRRVNFNPFTQTGLEDD